MKMDIRALDCTLDEATALVDAPINARKVRLIKEALLARGDSDTFLDAVIEILGEGVIQ